MLSVIVCSLLPTACYVLLVLLFVAGVVACCALLFVMVCLLCAACGLLFVCVLFVVVVV